MRFAYPFIILLVLIGCSANDQSAAKPSATDSVVATQIASDSIGRVDTLDIAEDTSTAPVEQPVGVQNNAFRNIHIKRLAHTRFEITGEARVFEAAFSWGVDDGHREVATGHETASAGAPAWAPFSFVVNAPKDQENSKLMLTLYELSAESGKRVNELPVLLY